MPHRMLSIRRTINDKPKRTMIALQSRRNRTTPRSAVDTSHACQEVPSHAITVNPARSLLVEVRPRHIALAQPLIHSEDDLGRDLRAQERRFLMASIFPLGKVLGQTCEPDGRGRLRVRAVRNRLLLLRPSRRRLQLSVVRRLQTSQACFH